MLTRAFDVFTAFPYIAGTDYFVRESLIEGSWAAAIAIACFCMLCASIMIRRSGLGSSQDGWFWFPASKLLLGMFYIPKQPHSRLFWLASRSNNSALRLSGSGNICGCLRSSDVIVRNGSDGSATRATSPANAFKDTRWSPSQRSSFNTADLR